MWKNFFLIPVSGFKWPDKLINCFLSQGPSYFFQEGEAAVRLIVSSVLRPYKCEPNAICPQHQRSLYVLCYCKLICTRFQLNNAFTSTVMITTKMLIKSKIKISVNKLENSDCVLTAGVHAEEPSICRRILQTSSPIVSSVVWNLDALAAFCHQNI